ncbi:MAG: penicillin-binding protein 2 [Patescibacteria group bacterium]|mgnify:CR=1 FL=1
MNNRERLRVKVILIGIIVVAVVLILSLYSRQIIDGKSYTLKADEQYGKPSSSLFDRGSIYFESKNGTRIAAATVERGFLVYVNPKLVKNGAQTYEALSQFLKINRVNFTKAVSRADDTYEEISHRADGITAQSINSLELNGIGTSPESWRFYSGGSLAAHALGLVGQNASSSNIEGRYGLEKYYQDILNRKNKGTGLGVFAELFTSVRDTVIGSSEKSGDIVTTIEPTVEGYLEKVLNDTYAEWHPDEIGGIIINPQNGEIAALALLPTFDPNNTSEIKDSKIFSNSLVEHIYEMGSIMKPLTMAMGFDSGNFSPSSTYDDTGTMVLNGKTIGNYDRKARGIIGMQQLLNQSLNIGAATIALKVGSTTMSDYFSKYGLGEKTGIDLPNEATGMIKNLKSGREIDVATAAYGQGISVSPIEMARALSILANGGYLIKPHLVKEIDDVGGGILKIDSAKDGPVLKKQTVTDVTKMLVEIVDTALKHGDIKMEKYTIAAKTGTAQIADRVNGGYYPDKYLHSFFGYFPAYNPRFLVFLYQVYPKGARYASETLTGPFNNLTKFLINYYNIPPDR